MKLRPAVRLACGDVAARADAYIDRELPAEVAANVLAHLAVCGSCTALVQERTFIKERVKSSVESIEAPARLIRMLHSAIRRQTEQRF